MKFILRVLLLIFVLLFCISLYADRKHSEEYYDLANDVLTSMKAGNTTVSVSILKDMAREFGEDDFIQTAYGVNMMLGGEFEEAKRIFNYIYDKNNNDKYVIYCLGILAIKDKDSEIANLYFDKIKDQISDYKTIKEYIKLVENTNAEISLTEEESFNSIAFDGYTLLRRGDIQDAKKFLDIITNVKGENAYIEQVGFLFSYDFSNAIFFNGVKYGDQLGLSVANRNKSSTVSGRITIRADISKLSNVRMLLFYIDDSFKGMSNSSPSITLDTTLYSNGVHDIRIDALDFENNIISTTNYSIDIFNKNTAPIYFDDNEMWEELWKFIQLKPSQAAINYMLAVCNAKLDDKAGHRFALERCVACNPDYKDAKSILTKTYMNKKGRKNVEKGPASKKRVAITFDDGPTKNTTELLDILAAYNAKATFFLVGKMAEKSPDIVRSMEAQGHQIALHSQNHLNLTRLNYDELQKEVLQGYCSVKACGVSPSLYLRPPGGNVNNNLGLLSEDYGINIIMWTKNTTHLQQSRPEQMAEYCFNSLKPGFIYLLHNNEPVTTKALPMILSYFKSMNYECVTLEELLGEK